MNKLSTYTTTTYKVTVYNLATITAITHVTCKNMTSALSVARLYTATGGKMAFINVETSVQIDCYEYRYTRIGFTIENGKLMFDTKFCYHSYKKATAWHKGEAGFHYV